eukprot:TRINITY_DN8_c0_g1_i1.p1 TRINITY_DN8_c0_g1~~TRINITY_DN8_c0_g1_i1.p1  ORF type:complete len:251 (-),score=60.03 TRINITY_DN8_c0_g1_i1:34-786(-)
MDPEIDFPNNDGLTTLKIRLYTGETKEYRLNLSEHTIQQLCDQIIYDFELDTNQVRLLHAGKVLSNTRIPLSQVTPNIPDGCTLLVSYRPRSLDSQQESRPVTPVNEPQQIIESGERSLRNAGLNETEIAFWRLRFFANRQLRGLRFPRTERRMRDVENDYLANVGNDPDEGDDRFLAFMQQRTQSRQVRGSFYHFLIATFAGFLIGPLCLLVFFDASSLLSQQTKSGLLIGVVMRLLLYLVRRVLSPSS